MNLRPVFHALVVCCMLMPFSQNALSQTRIGSAFSFQGQLRSSGNPLTANCDFQFKLYDAATGGNQVGPLRTLNRVAVQNGLFNVELDFGNTAFSGMRWLEVAVAYPSGSGAFVVLSPRHKLTPAPLALVAATVANGAITSAAIAGGAVTNEKISSLDWRKIIGAPTALPPTGAAQGDLTGSYPNPLIAPGAVTPDKLADEAVTSRSLADGAVTDDKILNVNWLKITDAPEAMPPTGAAGGVLAGQFPNPTLADLAVTSQALDDGAVTSRTLADGAVTNEKILSIDWIKITGAPTALPPSGAAGGVLAGIYPNPVLANSAVTSAALANGAVTSEKIRSVEWTKLTGAPTALPPSGLAGGVLSGTYPNPALAEQAVTSAALAQGAVTAAKLDDGAVTSRTLAAGAVTNEKILNVAWTKITGTPSALPPSGTASGDLTGSYPAPAIAPGAVTTAKLADGAVNDAKISGVAWAKISGAPTSLAPSGVAGGVLAGVYPNPSLADQAVTSRTLAADALTSRALAADAVTSRSIAGGAVTDEKIQSVAWNKITGSPSALPPSGAAAGDLTGSYPAPAIAAGAVSAGKLADGAVTTAKLADGAVGNAKIADVAWSKIVGAPSTLPPSGTAGGVLTGSYPNPALAGQAVTSAAIASGAVTDEKIASVNWSKIQGAPATLPPSGTAGGVLAGSYPNPTLAEQAVTSAALANGAVTSRTLAADAVTSRALAAGAVTDEKILNVAWNKITGTPTQLPPSGTAAGDLTGSYPAPAIAPGAVSTSKLANGAVTTAKLADGAVNDAKIADVAWSKISGVPSALPPSGAAGGALAGSYPNPSLADQAVTSSAIANGAVTSEKIRSVEWAQVTGAPSALPPSGLAGGALSGAYPNPALADLAVTSAALAQAAVTAAKLADNAVTSRALAADAVTSRSIAGGAVTDEKILSVAWNKITGTPSALPPSGTASGDLTGSYPAPAIAPAAVSTGKLADGAVTAAKLADGAVTAVKLADGAVSDVKIAGVAWSKISGAPSALPPSGVAGGALTGSYPNPALADGSVSTATIVNGAVTSATLAERAVTPAKLAVPMSVKGTTSAPKDAVFELVNHGPGYAVDGITYSSLAGVLGQSYGYNGWGLYGIAHVGEIGTGVGGESANGFGVTGRNLSTSNYGHLGTPNEGVYGESMSAEGHGVTGICDGGEAGIYGTTKGKGLAGLFIGNVETSGSFTAATNEYWMDHPVEPTTQWLTHTLVGSSERMNLYTGNVVTDASGLAEVVLPDYFEALNTDFRYQLTVIGQFAQAIVESEISNHRFTIRTDKPNVKVSWQVTGIRHDKYATEHPFFDVRPKAPEDIGLTQ